MLPPPRHCSRGHNPVRVAGGEGLGCYIILEACCAHIPKGNEKRLITKSSVPTIRRSTAMYKLTIVLGILLLTSVSLGQQNTAGTVSRSGSLTATWCAGPFTDATT